MKTKVFQDIKSTYGDTKEIVDALGVASKLADSTSRYYIEEARVHMEGLYKAAVSIEKEMKRLAKEVAVSAKRVKQAAKKTPAKTKKTSTAKKRK